MVKIFTTATCPRCGILKKKMTDKNIEFEECQDISEMESLGIEEVPQLMVDGELMNFGKANQYINNL